MDAVHSLLGPGVDQQVAAEHLHAVGAGHLAVGELRPALAGGPGVDRPGGGTLRHLAEGLLVARRLELGGGEAAVRQGRHAIAGTVVGQHRAADPCQGRTVGAHGEVEHLDGLASAVVDQVDGILGHEQPVRRELGKVGRPRAVGVGRQGGAGDVRGDLVEGPRPGIDGVEMADRHGRAGHPRADDPAAVGNEVHIFDIHQPTDIGHLALGSARGGRRGGGRGQAKAQQQGAKPDQTFHTDCPFPLTRSSRRKPWPRLFSCLS